MDFRISDTFTDSLAKLTGEEQKSVKTTAFDLQLNPAHPSMSLHRIEKSKDKYFWSVRAGSDIRLIVHKTAASLLLCYVDHHDKAYRWAERRKLETHPKTGAVQWVEIRERMEELPSNRTRITTERAATDLTIIGVDPFSRTPYCYERRSPRCKETTTPRRRIQRNFANK